MKKFGICFEIKKKYLFHNSYLADTHRTRPSEYEVFLHRKGVEEIFSVLSTYEDASRETKDYDTVKELLKFIHVLPDIYGVEKGTILIMRVEDSASTILFCKYRFEILPQIIGFFSLKYIYINILFYIRFPSGTSRGHYALPQSNALLFAYARRCKVALCSS